MEEALNVSGTPAETFTSGNGKKYTKYYIPSDFNRITKIEIKVITI